MNQPDKAIPNDWAPPSGVTTVWTIYNHPSDYPNHWVVAYDTIKTGYCVHEPYRWLRNSLEEARAVIAANHPGAVQLPRHPTDDPAIHECWM